MPQPNSKPAGRHRRPYWLAGVVVGVGVGVGDGVGVTAVMEVGVGDTMVSGLLALFLAQPERAAAETTSRVQARERGFMYREVIKR
jgi:hypothetical protein